MSISYPLPSARTVGQSGGRILRYSLAERVNHWISGASYVYCLITGLAFWSPYMYWMAAIVGGGPTARFWHPWFGLVFTISTIVMFNMWRRDMAVTQADLAWKKAMPHYIRNEDEQLPPVGRFNYGQKIFFWVMFYGAILLAILVKLRPWRLLAAELGGLVAFGFAIHGIASAAYPRLVDGESIGSGVSARALDHWMLFPKNPVKIADVAYILLVAAIVVYPQLSRVWRAVLLPPLLYLVMFVWENLLLVHIGGATRLILLGAMLVALMNIRPQGLFGTATVEIA